MLKRDLEAGGGGVGNARGGQTPSSAWEGQGLRGQRPRKVAGAKREGGLQGWGEPGTLQVWMVNKPPNLVPENRVLGCETLRQKVPASDACGE